MRITKYFLTICILAVGGLVYSQPGYPGRRSVADSLMNEGIVPDAITEFRKIYNTNPGNRRNVYNYACALSVNKQLDSSLKYLNTVVKMDTSLSGQTGSLNKEFSTAPSGKIAFKLVNNKTTLPVRIGDSRLLRIVLDSGMGWDGIVITNPDLIDSIKLQNPQDANIGGAGNSGQSTAVFADSMSFSAGDFEFENQRVVVLRSGGFRGGAFDGVTGYSIFGHYIVEVNYDRSEIILHQPGEFKADKTWTEIPIYFRENMIPWINARIVIENEEPLAVSCYIDYASSEAIELLLRSDQKFRIPDKTEDYFLGRGLSGDIHGKKGRISKVIIGPYELNNVLAAFAPAEVRSKQKGADGVISNNLLRRFNLVFDYSKKTLYIKPNSFFNDPFYN